MSGRIRIPIAPTSAFCKRHSSVGLLHVCSNGSWKAPFRFAHLLGPLTSTANPNGFRLKATMVAGLRGYHPGNRGVDLQPNGLRHSGHVGSWKPYFALRMHWDR